MRRSFKRSYDSLGEIFTFIREFFTREQIESDSLYVFCLAAEELFTNMVKYSPEGTGDIQLELCRNGDDLQLVLNDFDVERFDVTQAPPVAVDAPLAERRPGGLGLHLVRNLADRMTYEYSGRQSRITVTKKLGQERC